MALKKKELPKKAPNIDMTNIDAINAGILAAQSELVESRRSHAARELANTGRLKELRVHIARLKTTLTKLTKEAAATKVVSHAKEKA